MSKNEIRVERARKRMTQQDLAKKTGVSRQTIHAIENEKFDPNLETAKKIAKALNKKIDDVFPD